MGRGTRILRGMVGMGAVFGVVGGGIIGAISAVMLLFFRDKIGDDMDLLLVAPFAWGGIAFLLGMLFGGLLAVIARGRSFAEVSIARVAAAGAAIGLIPAAVVAASDALGGGSFRDVQEPLMIFPPLTAVVATVALLIARRAKPDPVAEGEREPERS